MHVKLSTLLFSLYLSCASSFPFCNQISCACLFSATATLTTSFHHSLPFLLFPPIFLIPRTPFAHFKTSSLKQLHSSSTPFSSFFLLLLLSPSPPPPPPSFPPPPPPPPPP